MSGLFLISFPKRPKAEAAWKIPGVYCHKPKLTEKACQMTLRAASGDRECPLSVQGLHPEPGREAWLWGTPRARLDPRTATPNLSKASLKPVLGPTCRAIRLQGEEICSDRAAQGSLLPSFLNTIKSPRFRWTLGRGGGHNTGWNEMADQVGWKTAVDWISLKEVKVDHLRAAGAPARMSDTLHEQ